MVHFLNGLIFYLLLKSFKVSIVRSESDALVHLIPGKEMSLNCSEISSITIGNVRVQNIGKCDRNQQECNLNNNDYQLIKRCEGSTSCQVDGSLLTSECLWEDLFFELSYTCKASYEYVSCYQDNILGLRAFGEAHKENTAMSADICFVICTKTSYAHKFFGTQFGHECFCGDGKKLDSYPFYKRKSECNMPCLEHNDEMCGDRNRMSVYKITTQNLITRSCLKVNQTNMIQDCKANQLEEDSLCIKFDVFNTDMGVDETCRDREKEIGKKLYRFCENTPLNGDCVYNLSRFLPADIAMKPPAKYISIVYSCQSTSDYANETNSKVTSKSNIGMIIGSVVGSIICLCIVFIGVYIERRFVLCDKSKEKLRNNPDCMILDSIQTSIDGSKFANTNQAYVFAKPIHDTNGHQDDMYAVSPEGTYDHSGTTRHYKDQDIIYNHAVDNVYDSTSRGVNIARKEDTYDHFFEKETEDEYNISRH